MKKKIKLFFKNLDSKT